MPHLILVVEDDGDVRETVADVLTEAGHRVRTASDGSKALAMLRAGEVEPCLILLDLMMPCIGGAQVAASLRADPRFAAIPIVFFSATGRRDLPRGATLLHKPFSLDELLAVVDLRCGCRAHDRTRQAG